MIEGLRVFPAYQDARSKRTVVGSEGCEECKRTVSVSARQAVGCGWERPTADARPWAPSTWADRGWETTACPGYTTALPCVLEVAGCHAQWKAGTLTDFLGGEPAHAVALDALAWFDTALEIHKADVMRESMPKRGAA